MSNNLIAVVPVLDGSNWPTCSEQMIAYLMSQGRWGNVDGSITQPAVVVSGTTRDSTTADAWKEKDVRAMGTIRLRCSPALRGALSTKIPADQHPAPAFAKISKHFDTLEAAKVKIPMVIQSLICLYALPSRYENIAQMLVQATSADNMSIGAVREAVTTAWDQSQGKKPEKLGAHKISAVKRKPGDPSFSSQQQQRPQGSSSNARDGKKRPYRSKRAGKKRQGQNHDHHHAHDVLIASTSPFLLQPSLTSSTSHPPAARLGRSKSKVCSTRLLRRIPVTTTTSVSRKPSSSHGTLI
ncbi:hypothetical protein GLOTRDRAFT_30792 [Gloeophyllum trabeum ATCC 11539]|uniref:DUF4219 domain-containing protein n=1 Tax=Gloeophyllum trabeum (strain ATCC 11539 / FP-39264 / Madison 617) TaxID=670483 RepID=S7QP50_GLOTA|nr:uncharacterized protein GLOTRDRAFT_30792 [Gloeophyllum trabeum ATCC 11539]EPQ61303.1 hypothetical protein GLOTRDRAFT_30792 [Gloeophyllum trabeum ATCC 11539]